MVGEKLLSRCRPSCGTWGRGLVGGKAGGAMALSKAGFVPAPPWSAQVCIGQPDSHLEPTNQGYPAREGCRDGTELG